MADSLTPFPATITISGGWIPLLIEDVAFEPAIVTFRPGEIGLGIGTEGTRTATSVKLPRLQRQFPFTDSRGYPTLQSHAYWQEFADTIEQAFSLDREQIGENTRILALLAEIAGLADTALTQAQKTDTAVNLANSSINPTSVATAAASGDITIAAHNRIYGDGTSVAVNGGSVSGFAAGDYVTVYYSDAGRNGGEVTYRASTKAIAQTNGIHIVGSVTIPETGTQPATGPTAPGYSPPQGDRSPRYYEFLPMMEAE